MNASIPRLMLLCLLICLASGTVTGDETPLLDDHRRLGDPVRVENLTVWPVFTNAPVTTEAILSLHDAQAKGLAQVRETGEAERGGATVNRLVIENRGDRPILVTAGTILKGGKQDRQIGQDLVVAAGATVPVDAFCVERGRWTDEREGRRTGGVFEVTKVKAAKRVRAAAHYDKDQGEVWRQVEEVNDKAENAPATSTFLATVEDDEATASRTRIEVAVRSYFAGLDGQTVVGFAYAVNGEPIGMRTFANRELLDAHFEPFAKTMSLEAQVAQQRDRKTGKAVFDETASGAALLEMVRGVAKATPETRQTASINQNRLRKNEWGGQSSCLIPSAGRWLPLTEDWTAPVELTPEVRRELLELRALGYTDP